MNGARDEVHGHYYHPLPVATLHHQTPPEQPHPDSAPAKVCAQHQQQEQAIVDLMTTTPPQKRIYYYYEVMLSARGIPEFKFDYL